MKKTLTTLCTLTFLATFLWSNKLEINYAEHSELIEQPRAENVYYIEDFESGAENWESEDATLPSSMWHLTTNGAYSGYSWWMGDPQIGGYLDNIYVVLDTDEILVPPEGELTFKLNYSCEDPYTSPQAPDYDGWDGGNVRISTDNGQTWQVLYGLPEYESSSMYGFGVIHGEGIGIPGWGGSSQGWVDASFDLSEYAGQEVRIRFAFASDAYTNTLDNPEWFGMMVDNIELGDFANYGSEDGMTSSTMVEIGGDWWYLGEPDGGAYSPTHAYICQNDVGSYEPNLMNYLYSPSIQMPTEGNIIADFMLKGSFLNDIGTYWSWDISLDDGTTWFPMSNPYNDPDGNNYVYGSPLQGWNSAINSYPGLTGRLDDYASETVKFRIGFFSSAADPLGMGILIDDFVILQQTYSGSPPQNVSIDTNDDFEVLLDWQSPDPENDVIGYNIYHCTDGSSFILLDEVGANISSYIHHTPEYGDTNYYYLTTVYNSGESYPSEIVFIYVPTQTTIELRYDNGIANDVFYAEPLNTASVLFIPPEGYETTKLTHVKVYLDEDVSGQVLLSGWYSSEEHSTLFFDNYPITVTVSQQKTGWNTISIPNEIDDILIDQPFYIGVIYTQNSTGIGFDNQTVGNSFLWTNNEPTSIDDGNLMIRTYLETEFTHAFDQPVVKKNLTLQNYPNPFNPKTTISLELPSKSYTEIYIYNLRGQKIRTLHKGVLPIGISTFVWDGKNDGNEILSSGIYFITAISENRRATKKIMLLK